MPKPDLAPLAIDGGPPLIPEGPPRWPRPNEAVRAALATAYIDGSWGRYHGPHFERLGAMLAELSGQNKPGWRKKWRKKVSGTNNSRSHRVELEILPRK